MQIVEFTADTLRFADAVPAALPAEGFVWLILDREELPALLPTVQQAAQHLGGSQLFDLHCRDLAYAAHPSNYDYTSVYDLIIFRRLATKGEMRGSTEDRELQDLTAAPSSASATRSGSPKGEEAREGGRASLATFRRIRSMAVGFAVFDRLLISVHPLHCHSAHEYIDRYLADAQLSVDSGGASAAASASTPTGVRSRLPFSPADLVLRMINTMVDSYLDVRRELTQQLDHWQEALLKTTSQFTDWSTLLMARNQLHMLEDLCDEQHDAMQEWLDSLREQPLAAGATKEARRLAQLQHDQLIARARDIIEHIQRVVHHVQRLEQSAETAVQIHFSVQSNRTNDIMKVLTTLTAIFLPLNLIAGVFGMNFKNMPALDWQDGFWITLGAMALITVTLSLWFWRKRFLDRV